MNYTTQKNTDAIELLPVTFADLTFYIILYLHSRLSMLYEQNSTDGNTIQYNKMLTKSLRLS